MKAFLSDARGFSLPRSYALTLPNFSLLSDLSLIEEICPKTWAKLLPKNA